MQSYLVPTPFVMANSNLCCAPSNKPGIPPDKNLCSKPQFTHSSSKSGYIQNQKPVAPVPLEVNVVIPPPTKPRDYSVRTPEGYLPRGPLSYDALVHLRRSASTKKTPLCPTVDHTIEKHLPAQIEGPNLPRLDRSQSESSKLKTSPPAVAPKPKKIIANISVKTPNEALITSDSSYSLKHATDPQVVRLEALQKLGLLKDQQPEIEVVAPPSPPKPNSFLDLKPKGFTKDLAKGNPSRSPSFCCSQVPTEPKNKPLQSSASFHHYSRPSEFPPQPAQSNGLKAADLERPTTLSGNRNGRNCPELGRVGVIEPVKADTTAQSVPPKPSNTVAYTVMVVPGMGADRKEALRKLGLLKD